jgi:hypothetical protein
MVCVKTHHHPVGEQNKAYMKIVPYKLKTTNEKLTSRAGLLTIAEVMALLNLQERIDKHFPSPKSNRGFKPSVFIQTLILMQHEGSFHLDEVRHISNDQGLRTLLGLHTLPVSTTLGGWLRRMSSNPQSFVSWVEVNKSILKSALHHCKGVTLDIDATEIIANKANAKWTYKKNKGYMPMVGHISETGQIVACDFRPGNTSPMKENLEFIQQCEQSLPEECFVKALRIDAAGYQTKIIKYCDDNTIKYAIRAKTNAEMKSLIDSRREEDWEPLIDNEGKKVDDESTCRAVSCIGEYEKSFTLIIQRKLLKEQTRDDVECLNTDEKIQSKNYIYRAIATNHDNWSNSKIVHWYNQRAEDSENRIKELKLDFGGDTLPCTDFNANALYLLISSLSFNLFALMRQLLPEYLSNHRVITIRWRLYGMAAKVVKTGRKFIVRLQEKNQILLEKVLVALRRFEPPPI